MDTTPRTSPAGKNEAEGGGGGVSTPAGLSGTMPAVEAPGGGGNTQVLVQPQATRNPERALESAPCTGMQQP